jgi:hypothetical protein
MWRPVEGVLIDALRMHAQMQVRRFGRLRWITKRRVLQHSGISIRKQPRVALPYLLWDPEVCSFTYDINNEGALADALARVLGCYRGDVEEAIAEAKSDPEFLERLPRRLRLAFRYKHIVRLNGQQLATWVVVRLRKPKLMVETGVLDGLGSLVALRALERNREEGYDGSLLSFDSALGTGWLVPDNLRHRWEFVQELTTEALPRELEGRRVDVFLHDTEQSPDHQRWEFRVAVEHASTRIVLIAASDWGPALREVAEAAGGYYEQFVDAPRNHFYGGARLGFACLDRGDRDRRASPER